MTIPQLSLEGFQSDRGKKLAKAAYRVGIDIYPHDNDPIFTQRESRARHLNWVRDETEGTITRFTWSKRLGRPSGTWSAVVKLGRNASIDPIAGDVLGGDWVDVRVNRNGFIFGLCRGVVDSVRLKTSSAGGATVKTLMLTGRDHGALFEAITAWNNIYVQTMSELIFGINAQRMPGEPGDTPSAMFERIIKGTLAQGTNKNRSAWMFPPALQTVTGSRIFIEELDFAGGDTRGFFLNEQEFWTSAGQTLDQTIANWCNPLLNEWYYDISPLKRIGGANAAMEATIRERPFVNTIDGMYSPFFDENIVTHWKVPNWMITDSDLGRSDNERHNIFEVMADLHYFNGQDQIAMTAPVYSKEQIRRYGLRPKLEHTKYIASRDDGEWESERKIWQRLIVDWYGPNPYFLSGTVPIGCMLPEVQIGSRLTLDTGDPKTSPTFYIEGVDHDFRWAQAGAGPSTSTNLYLTRGFVGPNKDYLEMVQKVAATYQDKF